MRVVGAVLVVVTTLAIAIATLHVALPPNLAPADGPADPFLLARWPVLHALKAIGLLDRRTVRSCLPSASGSGVETESSPCGEEHAVCRERLTREPVYRGLLQRVGWRVRYELLYFKDHDEDWHSVRLCYAAGGERVVAAENVDAEPDAARVSGFVPGAADGVWIEYTDGKGATHGLKGWGEIDPFWRD